MGQPKAGTQPSVLAARATDLSRANQVACRGHRGCSRQSIRPSRECRWGCGVACGIVPQEIWASLCATGSGPSTESLSIMRRRPTQRSSCGTPRGGAMSWSAWTRGPTPSTCRPCLASLPGHYSIERCGSACSNTWRNTGRHHKWSSRFSTSP